MMNFKYLSIGVDTSYSKISHDKLSFVLAGITYDRKCVILKNEIHNNRDASVPFAPSDVIPMAYDFAERCKMEGWFARDIFIDSGDQATVSEAEKFKRTNPCIYDFLNAWKKTKNVTRVQLQQCWLSNMDFLIVEDCVDYISEMDVYGFDEKGQLEDANDHSIQAGQYAWLPYKEEIGDWDTIQELVKDAKEGEK